MNTGGQSSFLGRVSSQKSKVVTKIERIILLEKISWRTKSRALWMKEGDQNMKFFHKVANSHWKNNTKKMLNIDGVACTEALAF